MLINLIMEAAGQASASLLLPSLSGSRAHLDTNCGLGTCSVWFSGGAVSAMAYTKYIKAELRLVPKFTTILHSGMLFDLHNAHYDVQAFFTLHKIKGRQIDV